MKITRPNEGYIDRQDFPDGGILPLYNQFDISPRESSLDLYIYPDGDVEFEIDIDKAATTSVCFTISVDDLQRIVNTAYELMNKRSNKELPK